MKTVRVTIDSLRAATSAGGRIDSDRVDATAEAEIARQAARDEAQAAHRTRHESCGACASAWGREIEIGLAALR